MGARLPLRAILAALVLGVAVAAALAQRIDGDRDYWGSGLKAAPLLAESQLIPPGVRQIGEFPKPIMMPPHADPLFGGLKVFGTASWRYVPYEMDPPSPRQIPMPWFWVILTDDFHRSANLQGWVGRDAYTWDSTLPYRCELDAQARYCVRPTVPGPGGQGSELFLDGRVNSHEAVAWHGYAGEGTQPGWRVTWYDPGQDVTYRVHLFGCIPSPRVCRGPDLAGEVSDWQLSPDNRGPAEALMRRIATFVPIEVK